MGSVSLNSDAVSIQEHRNLIYAPQVTYSMVAEESVPLRLKFKQS